MQTVPFIETISSRVRIPGDGTRRAAFAVVLIAASDVLFYGHPVGISLSVFLVLLAVAVMSSNRLRATRHEWTLAGAILVLPLVPVVETIGPISVSFGFAGVAAFTLMATGNARVPWQTCLRRMAVLLTADICRITRQYSRWRRSARASVLPHISTSANA